MTEFTTPSRRAGSSKLSTPGTSASQRFEHPAHRRLQSEAATSSRVSSPSPSSDRSARCRSTSLAPSSVRKKEELDRRWKEIGARCLSKWEMLEQKYAHITADDDDIVDITTLQIVVDRGVMRNTRDSVFGENLSDESGTDASGLASDGDELGRWDDMSRSGDEQEDTPQAESADDGERSMDEDDRWDLAEFLRKNAMMPNPEENYGEEEEGDEHGYPEVEIPGMEDEDSQEDDAERSETPDEEELQRRRNHRSGSMRWDSSEALFSDGVDMDNEDELAAADSDLEEATKRLPASARPEVSPDLDSAGPVRLRTSSKSPSRWTDDEVARGSASAGPSRARTPSAQSSRLASQPKARPSSTSSKKAAQQRRRYSADLVESEEDSDGQLFTRPAVPATEPKKRGRPKGSKNRPKALLEAPASEPIQRTKKSLPKSRSLPSFNADAPTGATRGTRDTVEVRNSDARSEPYAGAMPLVTLDDLFSPPPDEHNHDAPRKQPPSSAPSNKEVQTHSQLPDTVPRLASATPHRPGNIAQMRHQSSASSLDKRNNRTPKPAQGLDPKYYYSSPQKTRGEGVKHCKACRLAGGLRDKLSDLCKGRMGISKCRFEEDNGDDEAFEDSQLDFSTAHRDSPPRTSEDEVRRRPDSVVRRLPDAVRRIRMDVGSEADDESSPSVHQRKLLKKRSEPPRPSWFAALKQTVGQAFVRGRQVSDTQSSGDEMMIDPALLEMDATNNVNPAPTREPRVDDEDDDEQQNIPAPKIARQPSVFREPAPSKGGARDYTRPRVAHSDAPEPPDRDGYAPNLYFRSSGSYRLCALCRRAGGEREKYAMYCPGRTQSSKLCSFEGSAPPKARAATPAPHSAVREMRAATPGKRRYIPRATPAPTPGPSTEEDSSSGGRGQRKRKRVNYEERHYDTENDSHDSSFTSVDKENLPPRHRSVHVLSQSHLPTPSPSVSAPNGSTSISPSSIYRSMTSPVDILRPRRVSSLANARPTPPPSSSALPARGSSEALGWSWNRGSTPQRGILRRRPSESSASEEPRSTKRIRFSQAPRSPSNGYSPAPRFTAEESPRGDASEDELLLHDNSSPPADDEGPNRRRSTGTIDSPPMSRELRIRAIDANVSIPHHTGRLPSTLLRNIGPVQPNASFVPGVSASPSPSLLRHTNPQIAALMLPPPLPTKGTPSRIGLSPLSRELLLAKTPAGQSTQGPDMTRRAVSTVPVQRTMEPHVVKRHWSTAPRKTALEKDPDWVPGRSG